MSVQRVVVVANGEIGDLSFTRSLIKTGDYIICADGGAVHALAMGLQPHLVVGDMDSLPAPVTGQLQRGSTELLPFPPEKDKSDLDLALERALSMNPAEILILGALGGERFDQAFGNLMLLTVPFKAGIPAIIADERHRICLMEEEIIVEGRPGHTLSLFPLTAAVVNITTEGLKYPLKGETLHFGSTRGLSNEFIAPSARVTAGAGLLLVIHYASHPQSF